MCSGQLFAILQCFLYVYIIFIAKHKWLDVVLPFINYTIFHRFKTFKISKGIKSHHCIDSKVGFFCRTQEGPTYTWVFNFHTLVGTYVCMYICKTITQPIRTRKTQATSKDKKITQPLRTKKKVTEPLGTKKK